MAALLELNSRIEQALVDIYGKEVMFPPTAISPNWEEK